MAIDVSARVPLWVGYAEYIGSGSDKFYEARVDQDTVSTWLVTKRYGARPDTGEGGQIRQETFSSRVAAESAAVKVFDSKLDKGYDACPWPFGSAAMPDFRDPEAVERWLAR